MADGQFDNLAGKGQPLPDRVDYNPHAVLHHAQDESDISGRGWFAPEWVRLRVDPRPVHDVLRAELKEGQADLGPAPLNQTN